MKGSGISFVDIDETLFRTFAKVHVVKDGATIKKLNNQEYNEYKLQEGESYDYQEFKDGKLFLETSIPIRQTIELIKNIIEKIKKNKKKSKIIFLTARQDFLDKDNFLEAFRKEGFDIDDKNLMYIERAGNDRTGSIEEKKQKVIMKYLEEGDYTLCQIMDDYENNIAILKEISKNISRKIINKIVEINNIEENENIITFEGYKVSNDGTISKVFENQIKK